MTKLLQKAFQEASKLPDPLQDILAKEFIEEMEWEAKWDKTLEESQNVLDTLSDKAKKDFEEGNTEEKGFDEL